MSPERNLPCPCWSGLKFKKCCFLKEVQESPEADFIQTNKKYFDLKWATGEEFVHNLAKNTFLLDWCFLNPLLPDKKELCDLLIVFDDIAVIWQIKNTKLTDREQIKEKDYLKNLRQLIWAKRALSEQHDVLTLENARGVSVTIETSKIREIHLIAAFVGDAPITHSPSEEMKDEVIRIFTRSFTEKILNELDTISDFIEYLRKSREFLMSSSRLMIDGWEEQMLGLYIHDNRDFSRISWDENTMCVLLDDFWDGVMDDPAYIQKRKDDKISYYWDRLIDMAFETYSPQYELVGRELARLSRLNRRIMAQAFSDAYWHTTENKIPFFRRVTQIDGVTFCILFHSSDWYDPEKYRVARKNHLETLMLCARWKEEFRGNKKVVGIAAECWSNGSHSFDFGLYVKEEWTEEDEESRLELQEETGIFRSPSMYQVQYKEYWDQKL